MHTVLLRHLEPNLACHVKITDSALSDAEDYVRFIREVNKEPDASKTRAAARLGLRCREDPETVRSTVSTAAVRGENMGVADATMK